MRRKFTVGITASGADPAQNVIKGLRMQDEFDVQIVAIDSDYNNSGRYMADNGCRVPTAGDRNYISELLSVVRQCKIDLLIPIFDTEFAPISKDSDRFESLGCRIALAGRSNSVEICTHKRETYRLIQGLGLQTPYEFNPSGLFPKKSFPLFVKPNFGRASIGCFRCDNLQELQTAVSQHDDPMVLEYLGGADPPDGNPELTIDSISDFDGNYVGCCIRLREEIRGGGSVKGIILEDPQMVSVGGIRAEVKKIVEAAGVIGPACLQCFLVDGKPVWSEINPRFGGGTGLSIAGGFNGPLMLLKLLDGQKIEPDSWERTNVVRMVKYVGEVFLDSQFNPVRAHAGLVRFKDGL